MTATIKMEDIDEYAIVEGTKVESAAYSLQYLTQIACFYKTAGEVSIHLTPEIPLCLIYNVSETSNVKFWVSPRIEDD
jgi:hypothetical protein